MPNSLSRRDFLKLSALALGGLAANPYFPDDPRADTGPLLRVATHSISVFDAPDIEARTVGFRFQDELLNVYYQVEADTPVYNRLWYRVWGGWVHSAFVQPVELRHNLVLTRLPDEQPRLSEVTVPFTQPYALDKWTGWSLFRDFKLYYASTHWIVDIVEGPDGGAWYKIEDELYDGFFYYVPAEHLRPIPDKELTPISPLVPFEDKRVEVSLDDQFLTAYEGDQVVLEATVSTGIFRGSTTNGYPTITPRGYHNIYSKMPSKHMGTGSRASGDGRPLPGVPWTSFFAQGGYAIHGTYWHNNFGIQMSSGCINMRNEHAKFLFRWLTPVSPPDRVERTGYGTRIIVF